jgi:hypothetical protein
MLGAGSVDRGAEPHALGRGGGARVEIGLGVARSNGADDGSTANYPR